MNITNVNIHNIFTEGKLKAVASIVIDNFIEVHDIKVVQGTDRLFVGMPSRKTADGEYKDIAHPISSEVREVIQTAVLKEYEKALADLLTELTAELENR